MDPTLITSLAPSDLLGLTSVRSGGKSTDPQAVERAAAQFEALLIGQLLKSARESQDSDWLGTDCNDAASSLLDLSEQQLSQALSSGGGLGFKKLITSGLTKATHEQR